LEELRAGVEARIASLPVAAAPGEKLTLEQIFLSTVGGSRSGAQELSWLS